ncbi:MAG TPA: tRNA preQ1(34) S-adenosylmethionine ribosyltransferase-isomerase QueA [Dissulfurispiraceae bacterium]|nr:tRNA preQ1(34) S-adenosylmethionine ribosyltransferase-isomerase QueA [Dissulfurispiraceae bacterium]
MKSADFDFALPEHLIASRPTAERDQSRLLVLHRNDACDHLHFRDIKAYFAPGDLLVVNNTRVFPARLFARKSSGGKLDIILVRPSGSMLAWEVLFRGQYTGRITVNGVLHAHIAEELSVEGGTRRILRFHELQEDEIEAALWQHGSMPLPPYIRREPDALDKERYQTVYAQNTGSIAAPTAGLHFTPALLADLRERGVSIGELTLHVGIGTFQPVRAKMLEEHAMASEFFVIPESLFEEIRKTKEAGHRVITVGTTATRALEGVASGRYTHGEVKKGALYGSTDIFIYPGYEFRITDALLTNFHLPRSTPLMLASAFRGFPALHKAYHEAMALGYRFFSYGDAMLIL